MAEQYIQIYHGEELVDTVSSITAYTINSGYTLIAYSEGTAGKTVVESGGCLTVSGGTVTATIIKRGGAMTVNSGTVSDVKLRAGASLTLNGTADTISVMGGGTLSVNNGGIAEKATLYVNGSLSVYEGGLIRDFTQLNGSTLLDGGDADKVLIKKGTFTVKNGSIAEDVELYQHECSLVVKEGGRVSGTVCKGAEITVESGSEISGTVLTGYEVYESTDVFIGIVTLKSGARHTGTLSISAYGELKAEEGSVVDFTVSDCNPENGVLISNLARITGTPLYTLTVRADQAAGTYQLADNASGGIALTLKGASAGDHEMSVSAAGQTDDYQAGTSCYKLSLNENGRLAFTVADAVFLNTSWKEGESVTASYCGEIVSGTAGDGIFFCDEALARTASSERGVGITVSGTATQSFSCDGISTRVEGITAEKMFFGGTIKKDAGTTGSDASYTISMGSGTFKNSIAAGDAVSNESDVTQFSDLNLQIEGGTYAKRVAGGMYYAGTDAGSATLEGNVEFVITGGTFNGRIYAGSNARNDSTGEQTVITGNVNLTIRAETADIYINEHIEAGSRGSGVVMGSVCVTFSGDGSKLHFSDDALVFGGSNGDYIRQYFDEKGALQREVSSAVKGSRDLVFSAYSGDFGTEIRLFQTASFSDDSSVNFTNEKLNMWSVETWNFEYGSSLSGLAGNEFTGDTLNFDVSEWTSGNEWVAVAGKAGALEDFLNASGVNFSGSAAELQSGCWTDGIYSLGLRYTDTEKTMAELAVTKL